MTIQVLTAPSEFVLSTSQYARTYRLIRELGSKNINISVYANKVSDDLSDLPGNITLHEFNRDNRLTYSISMYRDVYRYIRSGEIDLYQHANIGFRGSNPAIILPPDPDTPFLVGPAEGGHAVPQAEFKRTLNRQVGVDLPSPIDEAIARGVEPIFRRVINPIREKGFSVTLERADKIIAVHSDAKETLGEYTDSEKIEVIPYGVDMTKFPFNDRVGSELFLTIGNLIRRKGHRYLLDAMKYVTEEFPKAKLHIVGSGPLRDELESRATDNGIEESVTFHGFVDDDKLVELLHQARAFVHPSLSEGFSHVRLEAMSSGCPVIGTNVSGAHDLTRDGTDGRIVPTGDSQALAAAMLELLENDDLVEEMGRNAREKVERDHDYADIAQQYLEIYREMAKS
ncbi:glycosyltransferase family 4 protein [Halobacterium sp. KA-6]|uniref:glycosyltransferase family 4 protein n=1 Tax=Halobacterium sp. KA-6 TaxID=2896368 RepID=UPI001E336C3F|nr:glycosyltransferase family 4 protein [Halobacterium sp. KA-6]MCD2205031.1 glycosyltransferase family 4 protein [Halobacterium sp. KA-6]